MSGGERSNKTSFRVSGNRRQAGCPKNTDRNVGRNFERVVVEDFSGDLHQEVDDSMFNFIHGA